MEFEKAVRALRSSSLEKMTQSDFERWGLTEMKLHPHQLEGVKWLAERHDAGHGCILGDEMGLGKTLQVSRRSKGDDHHDANPIFFLPLVCLALAVFERC